MEIPIIGELGRVPSDPFVILEPIEEFIIKFASSLPSKPEDRQRLLAQYSQVKGYEFINENSKLNKYFKHQCRLAEEERKSRFEIENELEIRMSGNIEQMSVGAMCQILKENYRKGVAPYQVLDDEEYEQIFVYERDQDLFNKTVAILHEGFLSQRQTQAGLGLRVSSAFQKADKVSEVRKEMTMREDGSVGGWGGKKYSGLGTHNEYTAFRREQSMSYYNTSKDAEKQRK